MRRSTIVRFQSAIFCRLLCGPYGGCARDTFGYAGFLGNRSANLRTAATLHRIAAISGSSTFTEDIHSDQTRPKSPHPAVYHRRRHQQRRPAG
ncbi:hypothetical protein PspCFBP13528_12410 [Pseudomonas sp. CFBP13528]|nr:hypothetical protein PspCFBP13528_12410 [Pseudomonas sp. CFBP13528]